MKNENIKSPIQQEDIIEAKIAEISQETYIVRERIDKCKICETTRDLRMGWCWDCAEAQNILATGKDMFEDDVEGQYEIPIKIVNERLEKLILKGWRKGNDTPLT